MSAFIVHEKHIDFVVSAAARLQVGCLNELGEPMTFTQIGQMLQDENIRSVECRYPLDEKTVLPPYRPTHRVAVDIQTPKGLAAILKAVACLEYQSCETRDWETTRAADFLKRTRDAAVSKIAFDLYRDIPWAIA